MADAGELLEPFRPRHGGEDLAGFFQPRVLIDRAVQKQNGTAHAGGEIHRVIAKTVETELAASPKDQQFRARKGRQFHRPKTMPHRGQHPVKYSFGDDGVRLHPAAMHRPQHRRRAHGNAVKDQLRVRQVGLCVLHRRGHVLRLVVSHGGVRFRGLARSAKIDQQDRHSQLLKNLRLVERAGFIAVITVKENDQRTVGDVRAIPRSQPDSFGARNREAAATGPEARGQKLAVWTRQIDAEQDRLHFLSKSHIRRFRRWFPARHIMGHRISLPIGGKIQQRERRHKNNGGRNANPA